MKLSEIKIPAWFSEPAPEKLAEYEKMYEENGNFPGKEPIRINENCYLMDGYVQYLVLKNHGVQNVNVNFMPYVDLKPNGFKNTTIIKAHHMDKQNGKAYIWRVTKKTKGIDNLAVGSVAVVETSGGAKKVIIDDYYKEDIHRIGIYVKEVISIEETNRKFKA